MAPGLNAEMTRGGGAGHSLSLQPRNRVWGEASERGVIEGTCPRTPSERSLDLTLTHGIVGPQTSSMTNMVGTILKVLISPFEGTYGTPPVGCGAQH